MRTPLLSALAFVGALLGTAYAQDVQRLPGESDTTFASRVLHAGADSDLHVTQADWNGTPSLFVDYETGGADDGTRPLVALQREPSGAYRILHITVGEQEGGVPDVAAIGFAHADTSPAKALIVILSWPVQHADVNGTLYEVRIFAAPTPGQSQLDPMKISAHFGSDCDCDRDDGAPTHYRFKTIAAVKAELRKLGY